MPQPLIPPPMMARSYSGLSPAAVTGPSVASPRAFPCSIWSYATTKLTIGPGNQPWGVRRVIRQASAPPADLTCGTELVAGVVFNLGEFALTACQPRGQ